MNEQAYTILRVRPTGRARKAPGGSTASAALVASEPTVESLSPSEVADARRAPDADVAPVLPMKLLEPVAKGDAALAHRARAVLGHRGRRRAGSPFSGAGVRVAILDTGIDATHPAFAGLQVVQRDFTGAGDGDGDGHGTHCAATITASHRGSTSCCVGKVISDGDASTATLWKAMWWALESEAHVVSVSLGIDFPGLVARLIDEGMAPEPATSRALEGYRDNLRQFGKLAELMATGGPSRRPALVVAATGNESRRDADRPYTIAAAPPAASDGFVAVGAVGRADSGALTVADFSNAGATLVAPGVDIPSAAPGGGVRLMSGTSMAVPHATGVAALWAERLLTSSVRLDVELLRARLTGTCDELAGDDVGAGLVRAPQDPGVRAGPDWLTRRSATTSSPTSGASSTTSTRSPSGWSRRGPRPRCDRWAPARARTRPTASAGASWRTACRAWRRSGRAARSTTPSGSGCGRSSSRRDGRPSWSVTATSESRPPCGRS